MSKRSPVNGFVLGYTYGIKNKCFWWKIDCKSNLTIEREFHTKNDTVHNTKEINQQALGRIYDYVENDYVALANNVQALHDGTERDGLGMFLCKTLKWSNTDAQLASQLCVIFCEAKVWQWNGLRVGIQFKRTPKYTGEWEKSIKNLYLNLLSKK